MAILLSKPVTMSVIPGTFGSGSDAGTLQGDTWLPGRDGQGVVNQVSWNLVPAGRWVSVTGTRMDSLDVRIKTALPNWRELSSWDRYTNSWSGMAPDLARSRVFFSGGGHSDGTNNGLFSFNFYRMGWDIDMLPSDTSLWSAGYRNSQNWGGCAESQAEVTLAVAAGTHSFTNDWWGDEVFWDNPKITNKSDQGKQCPKHTYHSYAYVPGENSVMFLHRRLWKLSLDARAYTFKRVINDSMGIQGRYPLLDSEHGLTVYDETTNELLASSAGSSGITNSIKYDLTTNTWTLNPSTYSPPWTIWDNLGNTRVGRTLTVVTPPTSGAREGRYWTYNLDSRRVLVSGTEFQYAGGLSRSSFCGDVYSFDGTALEYIAPLNRYWMWSLMTSETMQCLEIDPTTTPWTISATTFTGNVPTPQNNMLRKMFYVASMNAVWLYDRASRDWYVYRL